MIYECEMTDTFGGEANYCWVKRADVTVPDGASTQSVVIAAKRALGITGVRCTRKDAGDLITLRPHGLCQIVFIQWKEEDVGVNSMPTREETAARLVAEMRKEKI